MEVLTFWLDGICYVSGDRTRMTHAARRAKEALDQKRGVYKRRYYLVRNCVLYDSNNKMVRFEETNKTKRYSLFPFPEDCEKIRDFFLVFLGDPKGEQAYANGKKTDAYYTDLYGEVSIFDGERNIRRINVLLPSFADPEKYYERSYVDSPLINERGNIVYNNFIDMFFDVFEEEFMELKDLERRREEERLKEKREELTKKATELFDDATNKGKIFFSYLLVDKDDKEAAEYCYGIVIDEINGRGKIFPLERHGEFDVWKIMNRQYEYVFGKSFKRSSKDQRKV